MDEGRGAYYVEMIAKHGLVAIHTASSSPLVAPPGGIRPVLGTNPIAIAVPSSRGPIVLDMGTSAYMMTEVMLRERLGELLPEGVALGPGGEPTRDPMAARRGALLPFGGYKGFGLALMMQALGPLAGAGSDAESDYGYLFVAFRPTSLGQPTKSGQGQGRVSLSGFLDWSRCSMHALVAEGVRRPPFASRAIPDALFISRSELD
jgi:LDH2 family malate/lactate/ureidoglycolate dehydrogenase